MNAKSIAGQLGERRTRFALSSDPALPLADHWSVSDFVALTKPRVMMLAVFTALVGLSSAPVRLDPLSTFAAVLAIAAGAAAAGVLNMWYDADIDAVMTRTAMRPIPRGKISRFEALAFGLVLGGFAVAGLALATNLTAAALLVSAILFYIVVYTAWLKRATPQNIVIGGAAGALPPVIGWAAATGSVGLEPLALFLIIFLWTPPHFWSLALNRTDDYARAAVPMLPVVAGRATTTRQILIYSGLLVLVSELPWVLGFAGAIYGVIAAICGALFLLLARQLNRSIETDRRAAHRLFLFSIFYLFVLFAALLADHGSGSGAVRSACRPSTSARSNMRYGLLAVALIGVATLGGCTEGVLDPKGPIAAADRQILLNSLGIMLAIVVPVIVATLGVAFWFRASNERARYRPNFAYSGRLEMLVWSIPAMTVFLVGGVAWVGSHEVSPRKPIVSTVKPLRVQVASLDWKWLFIYPDQGVASVNRLIIPVGTPVSLELTSSGVMNSFFVPQLGSQIYTMAGMITRLHLQADHSGTYRGFSAQFSGEGFSDMHFDADAVPDERFAQWLDAVRSAGPSLDATTYADLAKPSTAVAPFTYRSVAPGLFAGILVSEVQSDNAMCRSYPTSMRAEK